MYGTYVTYIWLKKKIFNFSKKTNESLFSYQTTGHLCLVEVEHSEVQSHLFNFGFA